MNPHLVINEVLANHKDFAISKEPIEDLKQDASARSYHRIYTDTENGINSYVAMVMPQGQTGAEEKSSVAIHNELPFINVQRYLSNLHLPVPTIHINAESNGLLLLSDLGNQTLEQAIHTNPDKMIHLYKKAIDLLIDMQIKTNRNPSTECIAYQREFDFQLLHWELQHFVEFGLIEHFKANITKADTELIDQIINTITESLCQIPQTFVHRDFQSRNIMILDDSMYLIDFQDALLGPILYDLVALLRDSYIQLTSDQVQELLHYYFEHQQLSALDEVSFEQVNNWFHMITLHRKLKDAGRFEFINIKKKNNSFLPFIPTSMNYVNQALQQLPQFTQLHELLTRYGAL